MAEISLKDRMLIEAGFTPMKPREDGDGKRDVNGYPLTDDEDNEE